MKKTLSFLSLIAALLASLVGAGSCSNESRPIVYEYQPVSLEGWNKTDTISVSLPEISQTGMYQGAVGVRTNARYPYQNLWVGVTYCLQNPDTVFRDTVCCQVVHDSDFDKNGIGLFLSENSLPKHEFRSGQTGIIKIFHIMRREEIPGVDHVGICIQDVRHIQEP